MQIGVLVELVFQKINGHRPSTDSSILKADIRSMLPSAINYAADIAYNENIKIESDRDFPSEFYGEYTNVTINKNSGVPYITLSKGTIPLKGNAGIRFVYDNCGNYYAPLTDNAMPMIKHYIKLMTNTFWYRRVDGRLDLYGINALIDKINYQALTTIEDLSDSDEAPIQAGKEQMVIDYLINWFIKNIPYDSKINQRDDIDAQPYK